MVGSSPSSSTGADEDLHESDQSSISDTEEIVVYRNHEGVDHIASDPQGPFFVFTVPEIKLSPPADLDENAAGEGAPMPPLPRAVLIIPADDPVPADEPSSSASSPSGHNQKPVSDSESPLRYRLYTHDPTIHLLFVDSNSGTDILRSSLRPVTHSSNPYQPEPDPLKPLIRHIRQIALDPASKLHLPMLASLETVEHEMSSRHGSGLISFDEFVEHMREGRLRFLESWMEWVSI